MSDKIEFAYTINNLDNGIYKTGNECFNYGITWGCDEECPVFQKGKCELQKENEKFLKGLKDE